GIRTSLFVDPDPEALRYAAELGADAVELHTGEYAEAYKRSAAEAEAALQRLRSAAARARSLGLDVHAGHGLTYENVVPVAQIPEIRSEERRAGKESRTRAQQGHNKDTSIPTQH